MLVYPSAIDLTDASVRLLTRDLAARRHQIGTWWRRLPPGKQALLALAPLRCDDTYTWLAAAFGIGVASVRRYISEAVEVLVAIAPTLAQAVKAASAKAFVILDGTFLLIDRVAADQPYYSGKHQRHGMNVPVLTDPFGRLLWASPALPGAVHDIKAGPQPWQHRYPGGGQRALLGRPELSGRPGHHSRALPRSLEMSR